MPRRAPRVRSTDVEVRRVHAASGDSYVRVNTIGVTGERPFVLVPGIGVSSTYFERLAPNLNEFGPVHALDLPGFGGVPHPGRAMSIREYADLVGRAIDELGMRDPILVGHSMGSQVVSDLASRRADLMTLVLIGPVVNPDERRVTTAARRFLQSSWHEPGRVKLLAVTSYLFCGFRWFSRVLPKMMGYRLEDVLPSIAAHTLVIRGEFDAVCPRGWVDRIAELLPSSRSWEIPGAAHSVMYAHAEEVARLCVHHARQTVADGDDDRLKVFPELTDGRERHEEHEDASLGDGLKRLRGAVVETIGTVTHDDAKIAEGKTIHAEATAAARAEGDGPADLDPDPSDPDPVAAEGGPSRTPDS